MRRFFHTAITLAFLVMPCACTEVPAQNPDVAGLPILSSKQKEVLSGWLAKHPDLRPARNDECDCDDDIRNMRQEGSFGRPIPNYEPYVLVGDFNGKGRQDFAVILVSSTGKNSPSGVLAIFNGPFLSADQSPDFVENEGAITHRALFQTQQERYLLIGPFESEGCVYLPAGKGYKEDCAEE